MNALDELIGFWAAETGRRDVLQVPGAFVPLVGSADGAVFLAQLLAWGRDAPAHRTAPDGDGWVVASYAAWDAATALSRHRVEAATRRCQALGIVEMRGARRGQGRRYRVLAAPSRQPARQWDELGVTSCELREVGAGFKPARPGGKDQGGLRRVLEAGWLEGGRGEAGAALFDRACWEAARAELARTLPPPVYDRVVRDSVFAGVAGETVLVRAPSVNAAWWVNVRLIRPVERAVNLVAPGTGWLRVEATCQVSVLLFEGAADGAG